MSHAAVVATRRNDLVGKAMNAMHRAALAGFTDIARERGDTTFIDYGYTVERFIRDTQQTAAAAELFTASKDMQALTETIAGQLPAQTFELFDLPCDNGYLHLPVPLMIRDIRSEPLYICTVMWSRRSAAAKGKPNEKREGFAVWAFTDFAGPHDQVRDRLTQDEIDNYLLNCPEDSLLSWYWFEFGKEMWTFEDPDEGSRDNYDLWMQQRDESDYVPNGDGSFTCTTPNGATVIRRPNPLLQFLQSYWLMCQSELTDMEHEPLPRQVRRALERKQMPAGPVTVVVLRKKHYETRGEGGGWKLEYRYVRRAHTRRQWYGSGDAKYQKRILIASCVVGPDGAPWREAPVVNVLGR